MTYDHDLSVADTALVHVLYRGAQEIITNVGYYEDTLIRTTNGWRIQHRNCQQTMMLGSLPDEYEIPT